MNELNSSQSLTYQLSTNKNCKFDNLNDLDLMIANLKSDIFEKQQNEKDYCALESKFNQLQNDIKFISDQKIYLQNELEKLKNDSNKLISKMKNDNENLMNDLNERIVLNKKMFSENNNLYQNLESQVCENQNLNEKICQQEDTIQQINHDKANIENDILSLNHLVFCKFNQFIFF